MMSLTPLLLLSLAPLSLAAGGSNSGAFTSLLALLVFCLSFKIMFLSTHALESLLTLEGVMLTTMALMASLPASPHTTLFLLFFTLAVAEASVGLGVIIALSRSPSLQFSLRKLNKLLIFKIKIGPL